MTQNAEALEARLRRLEALEAIRTLVSRYAWYAALADAAEMVKLFAPQGVLEQPDGVKTGSAQIEAYFRQLPAGYIAPVVSNFIIEFPDDDTASGTCKMITMHVGAKPGLTGWYEDRYKRLDGRWLFERRKWTTQKPLIAEG